MFELSINKEIDQDKQDYMFLSVYIDKIYYRIF